MKLFQDANNIDNKPPIITTAVKNVSWDEISQIQIQLLPSKFSDIHNMKETYPLKNSALCTTVKFKEPWSEFLQPCGNTRCK